MSFMTLRTASLRSSIAPLLFVVLSVAATSPVAASDADELSLSPAEDVGMSTERLARIVPGMQRLIDADKIPGTVTLVARHGKVVHFEAIGSRHVGNGLPMEKDTIFRLYSQMG